MGNKRTALLIDGLNILFRAFYGLMTPMEAADGTPTNALYGFIRTLQSLVDAHSPDLVAVALDAPGPTRRHETFPQYKEGRDETPERLVPQILRLQGFLEALGIPTAEAPGHEADDVLASAAKRLAEDGWEVKVVSGDMDLLQILRPGVTVLRPKGRAAEVEPYSAEHMEKEYGFTPDRVPDYKALAGDNSDNIPGVRGVGPKTAGQWLAEHGDLDGVYAALDSFTPAKRKALEEAADLTPLFKALATLEEELEVNLPDAAVPDLTTDAARQELTALGMNSLLPDDVSEEAPDAEALAAGDLAREWKGAKAISFQRSPEGLLSMVESRLLSVAGEEGLLAEAPPDPAETLAAGCEVTGWDLKGLGLFARDDLRLRDLRTMSFLLFADRGTPRAIWPRYLERPAPQAGTARLQDLPEIASFLERELKAAGLDSYLAEVEEPFIRVAVGMEEAGVLLDPAPLERLRGEWEEALAGEEAAIHEAAGTSFNVRSPTQVAEVLFDRLGLPAKGSRSTRRAVLDELTDAHPVVGMILGYREKHKLLSTYVLPLLDSRGADGRIHPTFDPCGSATGRLACRDPNLQNLPVRTETGKRIREAFVAPPGKVLLSADYSQIDLRVLAHLAEDPGLAAVFREGRDVHTATAAFMTGKEEGAITGEERRRAKAINFGIVYGMGPMRLSREVGITLKEAKAEIEAYFGRFPRIGQWMEEVKEKGRETGYVETFDGRRRPLPDLASANRTLREEAERQAVNTPVQGGSADVIKRAMVRLAPRLGPDLLLLLQVHDELLFEVPEDKAEEAAAEVQDAMEGAVEWQTPMVAATKAGPNYSALV